MLNPMIEELRQRKDVSFKKVLIDLDSFINNKIKWRELVFSIQNHLCSTFGKTEAYQIEDAKIFLNFMQKFEANPELFNDISSKFVKSDFETKTTELREELLQKVENFEYPTPPPLIKLQFETKSKMLQNISKLYKETLETDLDEKTIITQNLGISSVSKLEKKHKVSAITRVGEKIFITGTSRGKIKIYKFSSLYESLEEGAKMVPNYKSTDIFHQSCISRLWTYTRKNDKKNVLLSADVRGKIVLSEIIIQNEEIRLNFLQKYNNCHFGPVRILRDLRSTQFFMSFTPREP